MAKKKYYNDSRSEKDVMIKEDRNAPANLPQNVVHKMYPAADDYRMFDLNDDLRGVDAQMYEDSKGGKKGKYPQKY